MAINKNKIIEDLEENNESISAKDVNLYGLLYQGLEKKDMDGFSLGFSKNIIRKIEAKQQRRFNIKMYCLAFVLLLVGIPLFIGFLNKDLILLLVSTFLKYKFVIIFLLISVILIQFGDKILSKKRLE
jgi:NADH:ubiquinone oxidoreductase subunit 2 (subunit N)